MPTRALALLLCLLPCLAYGGNPDLDDLCGPQAIAASGPQQEANQAQCRWALAPLRSDQAQRGDTCTCEALRNIAYELGVTGGLENIDQAGHACESGYFGVLFGAYAANRGTAFAGRVFGGLVGALGSQSLHSTDSALNEIVQAVSAGHAVAVALNPKPIYDYYAALRKTYNTTPSSVAAHALVVRAAIRDAAGEVSHFIVLDSSGPERLYPVPIVVFRKAYDSLLVRGSRGVYISAAVRP